MGYNKELFQIFGHTNMEKIMHDLPQEAFDRAVRRAFRRGAMPVKREIINKIPSKIKPIRKAVKIAVSRRELVAYVGVFGRMGLYVNRRGISWDPWTLGYWFAYGTYEKRSPLHRFIYPRRARSLRRKGGITPDFFIDKAWEASKSQAEAETEKTWGIEVDKFFEKNAYKG